MTMENASCAQLGNQGIKDQELNTENELVLSPYTIYHSSNDGLC